MSSRFRGDTDTMSWNLYSSYRNTETEMDLTGYTNMQFAYKKDTSTIVVIDGAVDGSITNKVNFDISDTDFDTAGVFDFDIQGISPTSKKKTFVKSSITIIDDINKG